MIEFNARFGDPETQALLFRLESDLVPLLVGAAEGRLARGVARRSGSAMPAVCVVMASEGYPRERTRPAARSRGSRRSRACPTQKCFTPARAGAARAGRRPAGACSA